MGNRKINSTAVVPKAMQEIAKELGAKVVVKKVMKSDINKPFKIQIQMEKLLDLLHLKLKEIIFENG